jgi:hypothetical protein
VQAASSAAKRSAAVAGLLSTAAFNIKAAVGPTLAQRLPAATDIHWKLMVLHYDGPEHVDTVFQLREELSHRCHFTSQQKSTVPACVIRPGLELAKACLLDGTARQLELVKDV